MSSFNYFTPKGEKKVASDRCIVREDFRVEKLCDHGVGHPIGHCHEAKVDPKTRKKSGWDSWMGVHGCDGCCNKGRFWMDLI